MFSIFIIRSLWLLQCYMGTKTGVRSRGATHWINHCLDSRCIPYSNHLHSLDLTTHTQKNNSFRVFFIIMKNVWKTSHKNRRKDESVVLQGHDKQSKIKLFSTFWVASTHSFTPYRHHSHSDFDLLLLKTKKKCI